MPFRLKLKILNLTEKKLMIGKAFIDTNILFSEDMQHLQVIDKTLTIINPLLENEIVKRAL